jgi:hypothetical protein
MNNIAISPHILMYALQNQNVEHKIVKKIDISMLNTGSVEHKQDDNGHNENRNDEHRNNENNKDNININTNLLDSSTNNTNSNIMGAELAVSSDLITETFETIGSGISGSGLGSGSGIGGSESGTTNISDI